MRRVVLLICFSIFLSAAAHAQDEQKQVILNVETARERSVRVNGFCELHFRIEKETRAGESLISVSVDNISPRTVILFYSEGSEESLKKGPVKIEFNKSFTGKKGTRTIARFPNLGNDMIIPRDEKGIILFSSTMEEGEPFSFTMPIYLAEFFHRDIAGGNNDISYSLVDMKSVGVTLELEKFIDTRIPMLYREYEELVAVLDTVKFCPNENHRPSLAIQKSMWQARMDAFSTKVDSVIAACIYSPERLAPYRELAEKVARITLEEEKRLIDCGQHYKEHECAYCGLSLRQIYMRMEDIYMQIISSDDRLAVKKRYWSRVFSMYKCAREAERTESDRGGYRDKIERYYKYIKAI